MEVDTGKEKRLLVRFDGRTKFARQLRDLRKKLIDERGGLSAIDTARLDAIDDFALLSLERRRMSDARLAGEEINLDRYGMLCDRCDRLARRMGKATHRPGAARPMTFDEKLAARRAAECAV